MSEFVDEPMYTEGPEPMRLRVAIGLYLAALVVLLAILWLWRFTDWVPFLVPVGVYAATGLTLNRKVLPRLIDWHPVYNTVSNVAGEKLRFFVLWPTNYGVLLTQLVIHRVL